MNPATRCFLTVDAETDHTVCARILHLVAVRGSTPEWFSARKLNDETLKISLELCDTNPHATSLLAHKIRNLPSVLAVETSWLTRPHQLTAPAAPPASPA